MIALAAAGCGGGGGGSVKLAELPPKLAGALCTAYQNCYGPIFSLFTNGADCVTVTEQRVLNGTFPLLQGRVDQGKLRYDGGKAQACIDSLSSRTCAQMLERDSPECLAALDGTVALGGACDFDEDCLGKAFCKSVDATCPGQCAALLVAGQACSQDSNCQDGLQCSSETQLCVAPAAVGEACEYGAPPCGPGLLCLGKDDTKKAPGACKSPGQAFAAQEGETCDPTTGLLCLSGLSCVADSFTLTPAAIVWKCVKSGSYAATAGCKPGIPDACAAGNTCKTGTGLQALTGTCVAIPSAGEACGSGLGTQCEPEAACVLGVCQNLAQNGVSCTGDAMCFSEYCGRSGGCEAKLPCK
ncbi:MAG TPA: hypothetical protein VF518_08410 [Polyangia bacterium]